MSAHRPIAGLMALAAASLAVMSSLHFAGELTGTKPFDPTRAGIAEALIGVVLVLGALALLSGRRGVALTATGLAIIGFVIGLTRTTAGGSVVDIAYHATVLPLLLITIAALRRRSRE